MSLYTELRTKVIGAPLDPLSEDTRHNIALVAFFAWVGLGADGISSSCYGPEDSFRALGEHTGLGLYLALAIQRRLHLHGLQMVILPMKI